MTGDKLAKRLSSFNRGTDNYFYYGEVLSVSPLSIKIDDDDIIQEGNLLLSPFCMEKKAVEDVHSHAYIDDSSSRTTSPETDFVTLWHGLAVGDKVTLISYNADNLYVVLFPLFGGEIV